MTTSTSCAGFRKKSEIPGLSLAEASERESKQPNNQQDDGRTVDLSWALVNRSQRAMPIERANALGNLRLAVSKSGVQLPCREGLRTLNNRIEGRNSHLSEFLSKLYVVRMADKVRDA